MKTQILVWKTRAPREGQITRNLSELDRKKCVDHRQCVDGITERKMIFRYPDASDRFDCLWVSLLARHPRGISSCEACYMEGSKLTRNCIRPRWGLIVEDVSNKRDLSPTPIIYHPAASQDHDFVLCHWLYLCMHYMIHTYRGMQVRTSQERE